MARGRVTSFDGDLFQDSQVNHMEMLLSSSWPAATPSSRHRPEPPRAPLRKPSDADWEVPPLQLPTGPRKRSSSTDGGSTTTREDAFDAPALLPAAAEDFADEEDEEEGIFGWEAGGGGHHVAAEDDEEDDGRFQLQLVGLDEDIGSPAGSEQGGERAGRRAASFSTSPQLGASPVLLSALERVAAEAGTHLGAGRYRIGTL